MKEPRAGGVSHAGFLLLVCVSFGLSVTASLAEEGSSATAVSEARAASCELLLATNSLPVDWVDRIRELAEVKDPLLAQLHRAAQNLGFTEVSVNIDEVNRIDAIRPAMKLVTGHTTNQGRTGRCWNFAGMELLRSLPVATGIVSPDFEYSQSYIQFFHLLEQSFDFLKMVDRTRHHQFSPDSLRSLLHARIEEGGLFERFVYLVSKYGLVPKEVMPDSPDLFSDASSMVADLEVQLRLAASQMRAVGDDYAAKLKAAKTGSGAKARVKQLKAEEREAMTQLQEAAMARVWRILSARMGTPPQEFDFTFRPMHTPMGMKPEQGQGDQDGMLIHPLLPVPLPEEDLNQIFFPSQRIRFTPKSFYGLLGKIFPGTFDLTNYVVLAASPSVDTGQVYGVRESSLDRLSDPKARVQARVLNVTIDRLEFLVAESLEAGVPVWFDADVSTGVYYDRKYLAPEIFNTDLVYGFAPETINEESKRRRDIYLGIHALNHAMVISGYAPEDNEGHIPYYFVDNSWGGRDPWVMSRKFVRQQVMQIVVPRAILSDDELQAWDSPAERIRGWIF